MNKLRWAVLGCGTIANEMAGVLKDAGHPFAAVGNRTHEKAVVFAEKYNISKVYDNYREMFTDPSIDAIYIATPHNKHYEAMKLALAGGKHILVEKAITLNSTELEDCLAIARKKNLIVAEAMTIFHLPLYKELRRMLDAGDLGKVNVITMNFGSFKEYDMNNRFYSRELAGGAMLDIGVYALSFMRFFMDSCPDRLSSYVVPAPTGVDAQSVIIAANKEDQMATVALTVHSKQPKRGMVSCDKGYIEIMDYPRSVKAQIIFTEGGIRTIECGNTASALLYEIEDFETAAADPLRREDESLLLLNLTRDVQNIMTELRHGWGMFYPEEEN